LGADRIPALSVHLVGGAMMPRQPSEAELRRGESLWGAKPEPEPPTHERLKLRLVSFQPIARGALRGFGVVELPNGLVIRDVAVFVGKNGPWCGLPSKPQIDSAGVVKRDANSRPAYSSILEWKSREIADRFSAEVIALILERCPDTLDGVGREQK
jgi:hypothetical protein